MESAGQGWTLIARFSNKDARNWIEDSGDWWYDKNAAAGETTDPSSNSDMISPAFWLVSGKEFKITRSDDPHHSALLQTSGDCLGGHTFRSKITSYGDFRNGNDWQGDGCRDSCSVQYGGQYETTQGFKQAKCDGDKQSASEIGFWCDVAYDCSVIMIGGGGTDCSRADHGIAVSSAKVASFVVGDGRKEFDFGDNAFHPQLKSMR